MHVATTRLEFLRKSLSGLGLWGLLVLIDVATRLASYLLLPVGKRVIGLGDALYLCLSIGDAGAEPVRGSLSSDSSFAVATAVSFVLASAAVTLLYRTGLRPIVRTLAILGCLLALYLLCLVFGHLARFDLGYPVLLASLVMASRLAFVVTLIKCSRSKYFGIIFSLWAAADTGSLLSSLYAPFAAVKFIYFRFLVDLGHPGFINAQDIWTILEIAMLIAAPAYFLITYIIRVKRSETIPRRRKRTLYLAYGTPLILLVLGVVVTVAFFFMVFDLWGSMEPTRPVTAGSRMQFLTKEEYPQWPRDSLSVQRRNIQCEANFARAVWALPESDRMNPSYWQLIRDEAERKSGGYESPDRGGRHADYLLIPLVKVSIGNVRGVFALDTGTSCCYIDTEFAHRVGRGLVPTSHLATPFIRGEDTLREQVRLDRLVYVPRMEVGTCVFEGFVAGVETINRKLNPIDGIIGATLLNHAPVTWNLQEGFLEFGPITDTSGARMVPIRLRKSEIEFPVLLGQKEIWVRLDTGGRSNDVLSLTRRTCAEWGVPSQSSGHHTGLSSARDRVETSAITNSLSVGGIPVPGSVELKANFNLAGWGLLCRFHKMAIDPPNRKMYLWPCEDNSGQSKYPPR